MEGTMLNAKEDSLVEALKIVDIEYPSAPSGPSAKLDIPGWPGFGVLIPLTTPERQQLESLRDLIVRYVNQKDHRRPLCIAVFGPPGSGKSFAVEQIQSEVSKCVNITLSATTINLTQLSSTAELAHALHAAVASSSKEPSSVPARSDDTRSEDSTTPIVFFDEFDTTRNGAPYGWLSWFLAPMHDGKFIHDGKNVSLRKAIYFFAGGTAATMDEFSQRECEGPFRSAKGPDFVSRLRGFLDMAGPNSDPRMLRRALIFRIELDRRVELAGRSKVRVKKELLEALLRAGRYRHGARSIAALVELAALDATQGALGWDILPDDHLVALQVDRGPLDPRVIDGSIAMSGFATQMTGSPNVKSLQQCWTEVAEALWDEGATLAFAGQLRFGSMDLPAILIDELKKRPLDLSREEASRSNPDPRFLSFLKGFDPNTALSEAEASLDGIQPTSIGCSFVVQPYLDEEERRWWADSKSREAGKLNWQVRALERFRRRLAVSEASVARFVVGGDPRPHGNRPSGIVEETILSLALKQPIYVAGGFGGAAADLGIVLGLATIRTGAIPDSLKSHLQAEEERWLEEISERLRPPPLTFLPVSPSEQVNFLRGHALDGPDWPYNGLSVKDNRALFQSNNPNEVVQLVIKGLLRRFIRD
jgi:hypothetical protein